MAVAHEAGDPGRMSNHTPRLVGEIHANKHVSGELVPPHLLADTALDLGYLFHGDFNLEDVVLHVQGGGAGFDVALHLVLVPGIGVDDVPVPRGYPHFRSECLDGVDVFLGLDGTLNGTLDDVYARFGFRFHRFLDVSVAGGICDLLRLFNDLFLGLGLGLVNEDVVGHHRGLAEFGFHRGNVRGFGAFGSLAGNRERVNGG